LSSSLVFDWLLELVADDASVPSPLLFGAVVVELLESSVAVLSLGALTLPLLPGLAGAAVSSPFDGAGADAEPLAELVDFESPLVSLCANAVAAVNAPAARKVAAILLMFMVVPPCGAEVRIARRRVHCRQHFEKRSRSAACVAIPEIDENASKHKETNRRVDLRITGCRCRCREGAALQTRDEPRPGFPPRIDPHLPRDVFLPARIHRG
jgi:hypothetical protein